MKITYFRLPCILLLFLLTVIGVFPQPTILCIDETRRKSDSQLNDCGDWKDLHLYQLSLCIPKEYEVKNTPSIEGGLIQFENKDLRFSISFNPDSFRPRTERRLASYEEEVFDRNPVRFWAWRMKNRSGWKYASGMNLWDENKKNYIASVFLYSNSDESFKLSSRIFKSACFESKK